MNPDLEIRRLLDLMPASGRMITKLVSKPDQHTVIDSPFPMPWMAVRPIWINLDLWRALSRPQRDLILLQKVHWTSGIRWFKPDLYRLGVVVGALTAGGEFLQADAMGAIAAGGLAALAGWQIWRSYRSPRMEIEADEAALQTAQRRGYTATEAARHLMEGMEAIAGIEGRSGLTFVEIIRCQNLRATAGLSPVGVPTSVKQLSL